jgi:regulator of RNase E activity RraA
LCTALFKRGLRNQFIQDVRPLAPKPKNMVGQAFTLRYIPAREDLNPLSAFQNPEASAARRRGAVPTRPSSW